MSTDAYGSAATRASTDFGLYVHIPFCRTKCPYCSFDSAAEQENLIPDYVEAVCDEIASRPPFARTFDTVYFGGGTPGMLDGEHLTRLVEFIRNELVVRPDAEWTIEVNPGDVNLDNARLWVSGAGFNRISLGVQSFNDNELQFLGRRHDAADALDAIGDLKSAGAAVCIDLIQGLPGQDTGARIKSIQTALNLEPVHVSVYELTIDEGSVFHDMRPALKMPDQNTAADGYLAASSFLRENGYIHYEVSNFCRGTPENASRHNRRYWEGRPWLGVGASAHSFDGSRRWWNVAGAAGYIRRMNTEGNPVAGEEILTDEQKRLERVALGFRWMGGVATCDLRAPDLESRLLKLERENLIIIRNERVHATIEGFLIADALARVLA